MTIPAARSVRSVVRSLTRAVLVVTLASSAAAAQRPRTSIVRHPPARVLDCTAPCTDSVTVKYLGSGGILLRHGGDAILTGPLFSNPGLIEVSGVLPVHARTDVIDRRMAAIFPDRQGIAAILVGHSHYDHLMDVPYIAEKYVPAVPIYGNATMLNLLASWPLRGRLRSVEGTAGDSAREGTWIYPKAEGPHATHTRADSTVRFMALRARHPAHYLLPPRTRGWSLPLHVYRREQREPATEYPATAWEWAEGESFAFVIDFLDERGTVLFRTHYADTPAWGANGMPPRSLGRFDLAALCVGGSNTVAGEDSIPTAMLRRIQPRYAFLIHWEDFFVPQTADPRPLSVLKKAIGPYQQRVAALLAPDHWSLPAPGDVARFAVHPRR